jgi:hypothetical protein
VQQHEKLILGRIMMKRTIFSLKNGCIAVIAAFCLLSLASPQAGAGNYYVDSAEGDDTNSGISPVAAWKTLKKINTSRFLPGDRILFKRGRIWFGGLTISCSGTAEKPITFGAYGPKSHYVPLIVGTYPNRPIEIKWVNIQGNIYKTVQPPWVNRPGIIFYRGKILPPVTTLKFRSVPASLAPGAILLQLDSIYRNMWVTSLKGNMVSGITFFVFDSTKQVYIRQLDENGHETQWNTRLDPPETVTDISALTEPGQWYWNQTDKAIYICSDGMPSSDVLIGAGDYGIQLKRNHHVTIEDMLVGGFSEVGVWVDNGHDINILNLIVFCTGSAGHKTGILLFNSNHCNVRNNIIHTSLGSGIVLYAFAHPDSGIESSFNRVAKNVVLYSASAGITMSADHLAQAPLIHNNIVEKNIIEHANTYVYDAGGIYMLNAGSDNIIRSNTIRNGGRTELRSAGIMIDGGVSSTVIEYNTIEDNSLCGIAVNGAGHHIRYNTVRNNGVPSWDTAQIILFPVHDNASNCTIQNNTIECGTGQKLFMKTSNPKVKELPHHIDFNSYFSSESNPFCWSDMWSCTEWTDFPTWKNKSGQDMHSTLSKCNQ